MSQQSQTMMSYSGRCFTKLDLVLKKTATICLAKIKQNHHKLVLFYRVWNQYCI